jgi:hypothetical protein
MSGEALNNTQFSWSELTVMDDCVRAVTRLLPVRYPLQLGQLQFHCGKPPPAAEPRTCIFKRGYFFERCDKKNHKHPPGQPRRVSCDQRLAMYIVISKPRRISVAVGFSHFIR